MPIHLAAFGAATFNYAVKDGKPHFFDFQCIGGQVPGEQTVPRAETWAAIVLMTRLNSNAVARLGIDAAYVTLGAGNRLKLIKGKNGDLWELFFLVFELRTVETHVFKVAPHMEDAGNQAVEEYVAFICDIVGNALADEAAELAAKLLRPSPAKCKEAELADT